jgi:hypothetical protein
MDTPPNTLGSAMRRLLAAITRRPIGWNIIDAFARLQESEEEERARERGRRSTRPDEPNELS